MKPSKQKIYSLIVLIATALQAYLPTLLKGIDTSGSTQELAAGILITIAAAFTVLYQRVSIEVKSQSAVILTWVLFAIAILGGLNKNVLEYLHFGDKWDIILRNTISFLFNVLVVVSKNFFPSDEAKTLANKEVELKQEKSINTNQ